MRYVAVLLLIICKTSVLLAKNDSLLTVVFKVDMNYTNVAFDKVYMSGTFNGWCGNCNLMIDNDSDGVYELALHFADTGEIQWQFTLDNWVHHENLIKGDSCTKTTEGFTNRILNVQRSRELDIYCFGKCGVCTSNTKEYTFRVDMGEIEKTEIEKVNLHGSFNNYCSDCHEMKDIDNDGIYESKLKLNPGEEVNYLFTLDGLKHQETFTGNESCVKQFEDKIYRTFIPTLNDSILNIVCYNHCTTCNANTNSEKQNVEFNIYPNPSIGVLIIKLKSKNYDQVSIFNIEGTRVYSATFINKEIMHIDLSNEPTGVYFVELTKGVTRLSKRVLLN
ncbi:MAG: T9SS type A sorting domain-containing protein [Bacteroidia bacterium]